MEIPIRQFSGIATKVSGTDQPLGTLRVADGVNVVPVGAITFGPVWGQVWGLTASYRATIDTALAGATTNKVHFISLAANGHTFLVAWEYQNGATSRARGIWHVAGTGSPDFGSTYSIVITATNNATYRDKTVGLNWYGSEIGGEIWLGNGTDGNLLWTAANTLTLLNASIASSTSDTSQFEFPPCKSWVRGSTGITYGAGNVTYPMRIWAAEIPNANFPTPHGLLSTGFSYSDVRGVNATAITALGAVGESLIAHMNIGGPIVLLRSSAQDGWKFDIRPVIANASAINPSAARDTKIGPLYLGRDLEIYAVKQRIGYDRADWRDPDIVTNQSSGAWNAAMTKPISGDDYFTIYDEKNSRLWTWSLMSAGSRQGVYCYDQQPQTVTGPWRYPDFVSACQIKDENLNGCVVLGFTRDGVLLWSDVANIGELTPPAYSTTLASPYLPVLVAPTSDAGIPYIGIDTVTGAAIQVLNGQTLYRADPWSEWSASGSVTPTVFYKNARLAVLEFAEMDAGQANLQKQFTNLRTLWQRNAYVYAIVACEVNGYRYHFFRGALFPYESFLSGINGLGATVKIRLILVTFNALAAPAVLQAVTPEFLPANFN